LNARASSWKRTVQEDHCCFARGRVEHEFRAILANGFCSPVDQRPPRFVARKLITVLRVVVAAIVCS
jgi:hypothetical protein